MAGKKQTDRVLIITGTGVPLFAAKSVYGPMMRATNAEVINLHGLGLSHTMHSVQSVKEVIDAGPTPLALIGHSQGGLVAAILDDLYPELFTKVITLGAPLTGTSLCNSISPFAGLRCMSHGSRLVNDLHAMPNMHNIVGTRDKAVIPMESGFLDGANHYVLEGVSHTGLIYDQKVLELIQQILAAPIRPKKQSAKQKAESVNQ